MLIAFSTITYYLKRINKEVISIVINGNNFLEHKFGIKLEDKETIVKEFLKAINPIFDIENPGGPTIYIRYKDGFVDSNINIYCRNIHNPKANIERIDIITLVFETKIFVYTM